MCHYHYSEQCAIFFKTLIKVSSLLTYLEVLFTITLFSLLYDNIECLSFLFVSGLANMLVTLGQTVFSCIVVHIALPSAQAQ